MSFQVCEKCTKGLVLLYHTCGRGFRFRVSGFGFRVWNRGQNRGGCAEGPLVLEQGLPNREVGRDNGCTLTDPETPRQHQLQL